MITAYIYIYNEEKSWKDVDSLRCDMSAFALERKSAVDRWIVREGDKKKKRGLKSVVSKMNRGDSLYTEDVSRLGGSLNDILEILSEALLRGVGIYGISDGFSTNSSVDVNSYLSALRDVNEIYSKMVSNRAKAVLNQRRAEGVRLGRPEGSATKMRSLIDNRDKIQEALDNGASVAALSRKYHVSYSTFRRYKTAYLQEGSPCHCESETKVSNNN